MPDLETLYEILDGPMDNRLPPQWAIDRANVVPEYITLPVSDYTRKTVVAMIANLLVAERERAQSEIREWLQNNMTFYNTSESDRPVLADVSKRIWYHATDSVAYPFDSVIDESL